MANNKIEERNTVILVLRDKLKKALMETSHYRAYWYSSFHIDEFKNYICKKIEVTLPEVFSNHQQNLSEMEQVLRTTPICNVVLTMANYVFTAKNEYISRNRVSEKQKKDMNDRYKAFEEEINTYVDSLVRYDGQMDIKKDPDYITVNNMINLLSAVDSYNKACALNSRSNLNYVTKLFAAYTVLSLYEKLDAQGDFRQSTLRAITIINNIFLKFLKDNYPKGNSQQEGNFKIILDRKKAVINRIHYILELFKSRLIADVGPEIINFIKNDQKIPAELSSLEAIKEIVALLGQNVTLPNAISYIMNQSKINDKYKNIVNSNKLNINSIQVKFDNIVRMNNELVNINSDIENEICKN